MNKLKTIVDQTQEQTIDNNDNRQKRTTESETPMTWPVLPDKALYGLVGDIVKAATENSEADPAAVLITALVYAGAAFGTQPCVPIGETSHQPRLMAAVVGASSRARKGTSANPVKRIFELAEKRHQLPQLKVSHGPLSSGEGLVFAVRDPSDKKNKKGEIEDEGVADKRLLVIEGELGAPLKALQRDGNTLSAILRTAWDHGNIAPLTKSNRIVATGAHICIVGHITSYELKSLLQTSDVWNGLANRLLWVCARRKKMVPFPKQMLDETIEELARKLALAITNATLTGTVHLSSETALIWESLYPEISRDESGVLGVITARAEAQVIRLALVYALLDQSSEILPEHLNAALSFWQYCRDSVRYIFGDTEKDPAVNKILLALSEGEKTQTELNDLFGGHLPGGQLKTILADLQAAGRVTQKREGGSKGKGKPITLWTLTPGFVSLGAEFADFAE